MLCKHYFSSCIFCINYDFIVLYVASLSWSVLAFSESLPLQIFYILSLFPFTNQEKYSWLNIAGSEQNLDWFMFLST